jgi:hypothetical protein
MPVTTEELVAVLKALPARDRDVDLDALITKARAEPFEKMENALAISAKTALPDAPKGKRLTYAAAGAGILVTCATLGIVTYKVFAGHKEQPVQPIVVGPGPTELQPLPGPRFIRPDWITSDVPSSGYCHEATGRLVCVGVSAYRTNREDGALEATDAALEELASSTGLQISDPYFRDVIATGYGAVRAKSLSTLQAASLNRTADAKAFTAYVAAADAIRKTRRRVVEVLQASGGAAVPAQRADWYWEEYQSEVDTSTEFLVYVRFDVSTDSVKALVNKYGTTTDVLGSRAMTAFPELGWSHDTFQGGVLLTKVGDRLAKSGVAPQDVVVAVGDQRVSDVSGLQRQLDGAKGEVKLSVVTANAAPRSVAVKK